MKGGKEVRKKFCAQSAALSSGSRLKRLLEKAAAAVQFWLGSWYYRKTNIPRTFRWWRKAAEHGHAGAQLWLAYFCDCGCFVEQNMIEAVHWYRKAAEQGDAEAQSRLGDCLRFGDGVEQNMTEAVQWYRRAAAQGDEWAKEALRQLRK